MISSFGSSRLKHSLHPEAPGFPWRLAALSLTARSLEEESWRHSHRSPTRWHLEPPALLVF